MIGFGNTKLLIQLIQESEKRQAQTLREIADATVLLAKAIEELVESRKIPEVPADAIPRDPVDEGALWLSYEKSRLQQMGQTITPDIEMRLQERASAMKVFNG